MSNFKVGDVCVVVHRGSSNDGMQCVITAAAEYRTWWRFDTREFRAGIAHLVCGEWAPEINDWHCKPENLRLKRPPSKDEFTAGSWELCGWSPYRVGETS